MIDQLWEIKAIEAGQAVFLKALVAVILYPVRFFPFKYFDCTSTIRLPDFAVSSTA